MSPDDEKRLAEIRKRYAAYPNEPAAFLLAKLDEERAKRIEGENALRDGELRRREDYFPEVAKLRQRNRDMHDRAQKAEVALAEERAKREAAVRDVRIMHDAVNRTAAQHSEDRRVWQARAETAEARLAELEANLDPWLKDTQAD